MKSLKFFISFIALRFNAQELYCFSKEKDTQQTQFIDLTFQKEIELDKQVDKLSQNIDNKLDKFQKDFINVSFNHLDIMNSIQKQKLINSFEELEKEFEIDFESLQKLIENQKVEISYFEERVKRLFEINKEIREQRITLENDLSFMSNVYRTQKFFKEQYITQRQKKSIEKRKQLIKDQLEKISQCLFMENNSVKYNSEFRISFWRFTILQLEHQIENFARKFKNKKEFISKEIYLPIRKEDEIL